MSEQLLVNPFVKMWTDRMDAVFKKYSEKKHPPAVLSETEALAVLLGMGEATMRLEPIDTETRKGLSVVVEARRPCVVEWDGEKMRITLMKSPEFQKPKP